MSHELFSKIMGFFKNWHMFTRRELFFDTARSFSFCAHSGEFKFTFFD